MYSIRTGLSRVLHIVKLVPSVILIILHIQAHKTLNLKILISKSLYLHQLFYHYLFLNKILTHWNFTDY